MSLFPETVSIAATSIYIETEYFFVGDDALTGGREVNSRDAQSSTTPGVCMAWHHKLIYVGHQALL